MGVDWGSRAFARRDGLRFATLSHPELRESVGLGFLLLEGGLVVAVASAGMAGWACRSVLAKQAGSRRTGNVLAVVLAILVAAITGTAFAKTALAETREVALILLEVLVGVVAALVVKGERKRRFARLALCFVVAAAAIVWIGSPAYYEESSFWTLMKTAMALWAGVGGLVVATVAVPRRRTLG